MTLRSVNNDVTSVFEEAKRMLEVSIKTLSSDEIVALAHFLKVVDSFFKSREEIFLLGGPNGDMNAYEKIAYLSEDTKTSESIINGREVMMIVYDKVKTFITSENGLKRVTDYLYMNTKKSYNRARKKYAKGGKKDVNIPCVTNISDELIVIHLAKDWNKFLLDIVNREYSMSKPQSN